MEINQKFRTNIIRFLPSRCSPRIKSTRKTGQVEANNRPNAAYHREGARHEKSNTHEVLNGIIERIQVLRIHFGLIKLFEWGNS